MPPPKEAVEAAAKLAKLRYGDTGEKHKKQNLAFPGPPSD
jgi:hypothetical protein